MSFLSYQPTHPKINHFCHYKFSTIDLPDFLFFFGRILKPTRNFYFLIKDINQLPTLYIYLYRPNYKIKMIRKSKKLLAHCLAPVSRNIAFRFCSKPLDEYMQILEGKAFLSYKIIKEIENPQFSVE
jgi:hypothetical protein